MKGSKTRPNEAVPKKRACGSPYAGGGGVAPRAIEFAILPVRCAPALPPKIANLTGHPPVALRLGRSLNRG